MSQRNLDLIRDFVKDLSAEDELDFLRAFAGGVCSILQTPQIHSLVMSSGITLALAKQIPRTETNDKNFRGRNFVICPGCGSNNKLYRLTVSDSTGNTRTACKHPWHN